MAIRTELSLRLQNSPGALMRVCHILADARVNVLAIVVEAGGVLRAVVDNPLHAVGALREHHYEVAESDVLYVQVPNDPGAFARVARLLADGGVNLEHLYGSAIDGHPMAAVVVGVEDAQRASAAAGV